MRHLTRWGGWLLLVLGLPILAMSATITPLPENNSLFFTRLRTFLQQEDASRYDKMFGPFVRSGGTAPTSVSLSHTVAAPEAFVHGVYVTQADTVLTYTNTRRAYIYLDSQNTARDPEITASGGSGCATVLRSGYLVQVECATGSSRPTLSVSGLALLFSADASGGAITTVSDGRFRSPHQEHTLEFHVKDFGATCDGVTDDTAAVNAAIQNIQVDRPLIKLCPGTMKVDGTVTITKALRLVGSGPGTTILLSATANTPQIVVNTGVLDVTIEDLEMSKTVDAVAGGDGIVIVGGTGANNHNNITLENVRVLNHYHALRLGPCAYCQAFQLDLSFNNGHGINVEYGPGPGAGVQWQISEALIQNNLGAGVYAVNSTVDSALGPFLSDCHVFNNKQGGVYLAGIDAAHPIHDVWLERLILSTNNVAGLYMDTHGAGHMLSQIWSELSGRENFAAGSQYNPQTPAMTTTSAGISFGTNTSGVILNGGVAWANGGPGVLVASGSPGSVVMGMKIEQNGLALSGNPYTDTGIYVNADRTVVQGNAFGVPGGETNYIYLGPNVATASIGLNSYHASLAQNAWVYLTDASALTMPGTMPLGQRLLVGTQRPFLIEEVQSAWRKWLAVSNTGVLSIQNHAGSANIFTLSDAGVPTFPGMTAAPGGSRAVCANAGGTLYLSATGSCPP